METKKVNVGTWRIFTNTLTLVAETKGPHIFARCVQKKCRQWESLALGLVSEFVPALQRHYTSSIPHWFSKDVNIPLTLLLRGTRQHDVSKITQKHNGTYVSPFSTTSYNIKASLQICGWLLRRVGFSWFWTVQLVRFTMFHLQFYQSLSLPSRTYKWLRAGVLPVGNTDRWFNLIFEHRPTSRKSLMTIVSGWCFKSPNGTLATPASMSWEVKVKWKGTVCSWHSPSYQMWVTA